jgi:hypothetical protein
MLTRVIILQDLENFCFLAPSPDGDVMFTPYLVQAGMFLDEEEAHDTAEMMHCEQYHLFVCFVDAETALKHRQ